jgi:ATP-binding protein involved in chromosome partitioning
MKNYDELPGDGGSDIPGQVVRQQGRIRKSLAGLAHIVAVASGKGGVGKSTVTMLLASSLHRAGHRTAVLDCDFNGPSLARMAGLRNARIIPGDRGLEVPKTRSGIGILSLGALIPEEEAIDFPSVASGDSYTWRATREFTLLGDLLAGTDWEPYDFLLLDLPPGNERAFQYAEYFGSSAVFLLISLPSAVSLGVVRRSVASIRKARARLMGYILNMDGYRCPECRTLQPLFSRQTGAELPIERLGGIPFDPVLAAACDSGKLGRAEAPVVEEVEEIGRKLMERLEFQQASPTSAAGSET